MSWCRSRWCKEKNERKSTGFPDYFPEFLSVQRPGKERIKGGAEGRVSRYHSSSCGEENIGGDNAFLDKIVLFIERKC